MKPIFDKIFNYFPVTIFQCSNIFESFGNLCLNNLILNYIFWSGIRNFLNNFFFKLDLLIFVQIILKKSFKLNNLVFPVAFANVFDEFLFFIYFLKSYSLKINEHVSTVRCFWFYYYNNNVSKISSIIILNRNNH